MRLSLCFRREARVHRIIWVNESSRGLYLGVLGGMKDSHVSYHGDGKRHARMGSGLCNEQEDVPIADWRGVRQLQHVSLSISKDWFHAGNEYVKDTASDVAIILDDRPFVPLARCAMDFWLLDRASEPEYFALVERGRSAENAIRPLVELVVPLEHFPNHKIAITLRPLG